MLKNIICSTLVLFSSTTFALDCGKYTHQNEMNECVCKEYEILDAKLNKVYQKVLHKYRNYPEVLKNSKIAENKWIAFRDAQVNMKFPPLKNGNFYGSIHPIFSCDYLKDLTAQRIKELKDILNNNQYVDELLELNNG